MKVDTKNIIDVTCKSHKVDIYYKDVANDVSIVYNKPYEAEAFYNVIKDFVVEDKTVVKEWQI